MKGKIPVAIGITAGGIVGWANVILGTGVVFITAINVVITFLYVTQK